MLSGLFIVTGEFDVRDPYVGGLVCALASIEVSCTIIAASIPFFRPMIRRLIARKENTPEQLGSIRVTPGSGREHVRLESTSNFGRKTPSDDDSVAA